MVPANNKILKLIKFSEKASENHRMNLRTQNIAGRTNKLKAMEQVIFKILNTERYKNIIYSWNFGIELEDLFGEATNYVCSELQRRISEALLQDSRIESVDGFVFDTSKRGVVAVDFVVHTIYGVVAFGKEVSY